MFVNISYGTLKLILTDALKTNPNADYAEWAQAQLVEISEREKLIEKRKKRLAEKIKRDSERRKEKPTDSNGAK